MRKHVLVPCMAFAMLASSPLMATEISFSGGASGTDPLGHAYSFDGTTFRLGTVLPTTGFNPSGTPIGDGTGIRSFSISLVGPAPLNPTPVDVPNACPPGQYAVYISLNPLTIICVGLTGGGPIIRHTWQYEMRTAGVGGFEAPPEGVLFADTTGFEFTMAFPTPIDPSTFAFTATWSDVAAIPEPATAALFALGVAGLGVAVRRRRRA